MTGRPACGTWTALLLEAAPAKGCQGRDRRQCSVAVRSSTDTQLAVVPMRPSTPCPLAPGTLASPCLVHPPRGPACTVRKSLRPQSSQRCEDWV